MKNRFLFFSFLIFFNTSILAENFKIESKNISLDKNNQVTIFKEQVFIKTEDGNNIRSDYAEYDKDKNIIILKENIIATDKLNNKISTNYAVYNKNNKIFESKGSTKIVTSEEYIINGRNIIFNNNKKLISSTEDTEITDIDNNKIYLTNFEYQTTTNIFKSIGEIEINDKINNTYKFSQIYIDTKKKEIIGSDVKTFLNQEGFKSNEKNKPRIFSNSVKLNNEISSFEKSIFTLCDYRKNDKCPPWSVQSSRMLHDNKKKTIYYDNAVIKFFDIPIFYFPKLSHPDPSVDRRSGFLIPSLSSSKNLGSGVTVPYFFALNDNRDFTLTNRLYVSENPLFLGEYRHAFKNSNLITNFGFTEGYKKTSAKKKKGEKSHFFSQYVKNFLGKNGSENTFKFQTQEVSNDKYLKLYKIDTDLVDYSGDSLENSLSFTHEADNIFLGLDATIYETLKPNYIDKYEYLLPELTLDKNLFSSNKMGILDIQTNFKSHLYDINKKTDFLINDFDWDMKSIYYNSGIKSKLFSKIKNVNYETNNVNEYKSDTTSEIFGAIGYLSEFDLFKKSKNLTTHQITPKIMLRYAPEHMRKEDGSDKLNSLNLFTLNRINNTNNFEGGLSSTLGFDYELDKNDKKFKLSLGQVINAKENKNMPTSSSLDEKLSDVIGSSTLTLNKKFDLDYSFSVDQNYKELNYNEVGANLNLDLFKFNIDYLQEKKHIGVQEYVKAGINYSNNENSTFKFETKKNLITNSSEFYDLSYEYMNDCLKAGLVYRREFYNDSELESENSLMFKITLVPFGEINAPAYNK